MLRTGRSRSVALHVASLDAVTVRYRTVLHRTEADFHHSGFLPSQAHYFAPTALGFSGATLLH